MTRRLLCTVLLLTLLGQASYAGIFFNRKTKKVNPAKRVPHLVVQVQTNGDERQRAQAAEELREYDVTAFPQIVPVLIHVLLRDKKSSVRAEAAQSLGRIRPISQRVGRALEHTIANDSSMRVRLQARTSLLHYRWAGYRREKDPEPAKIAPQTKEPPLADPPMAQPTPSVSARETAPPPIIDTKGAARRRFRAPGWPAPPKPPAGARPMDVPRNSDVPDLRPVPTTPDLPGETEAPPVARPLPGSDEGPDL